MNFRQIWPKILIYTIIKHLTYEICQRKFGRVKGALGSTWYIHKVLLLSFTIPLCSKSELRWGQPRLNWCLYAVLEWANDKDKIACFCHQTQGQHIPWTFNLIWWLRLDLELTPTEIYYVTWNPRIRATVPRAWMGEAQMEFKEPCKAPAQS